MNLEDLRAALDVWTVDSNVTVESSWAHQRWVEHIGPICTSENDHVFTRTEAVHLDKELVERAFALIVAAKLATLATGLADSVDLVHKDDARGILLGRRKEVTHARGTHAHKHFDKLGARNAKEWNTGLTGRGLGEQGLASTRGTREDGTCRDLGAKLFVNGRVLEELYKFHNLLLCFIHPRHVLKLDLYVRFLIEHLSPGLADSKNSLRASPGSSPPRHVKQHARKQQGRCKVQ
ncbi:hypothetical protein BC937DRAFT_88461 [Endogone sp. FLAS-F59071]|nr:hypothetical protein BC937DRAFT_88461 [Endogone sp. FLAS-F59071]|eukprot:RUS18688.1 hypothetical protein BC937DRAFT_88461 [Endogone sp. FLAS-F59071]